MNTDFIPYDDLKIQLGLNNLKIKELFQKRNLPLFLRINPNKYLENRVSKVKWVNEKILAYKLGEHRLKETVVQHITTPRREFISAETVYNRFLRYFDNSYTNNQFADNEVENHYITDFVFQIDYKIYKYNLISNPTPISITNKKVSSSKKTIAHLKPIKYLELFPSRCLELYKEKSIRQSISLNFEDLNSYSILPIFQKMILMGNNETIQKENLFLVPFQSNAENEKDYLQRNDRHLVILKNHKENQKHFALEMNRQEPSEYSKNLANALSNYELTLHPLIFHKFRLDPINSTTSQLLIKKSTLPVEMQSKLKLTKIDKNFDWGQFSHNLQYLLQSFNKAQACSKNHIHPDNSKHMVESFKSILKEVKVSPEKTEKNILFLCNLSRFIYEDSSPQAQKDKLLLLKKICNFYSDLKKNEFQNSQSIESFFNVENNDEIPEYYIEYLKDLFNSGSHSLNKTTMKFLSQIVTKKE